MGEDEAEAVQKQLDDEAAAKKIATSLIAKASRLIRLRLRVTMVTASLLRKDDLHLSALVTTTSDAVDQDQKLLQKLLQKLA